ncbi:amidohydrolase [Psychrilyobacter sp.]|uniref:M20 metallopeptidase family protein n=1 Tax=Psychrilyobacter sp. TaxID=2586924 RepID=UPI00301A3BE7
MDSNKFLELAKEISPWLSKVRRDFHMYPELGMEEFRTQRKICEYLDEFGVLYKKMAKTGVVGEIKGKDAVKTIALRADMDALPILEKNDVSYRSKNHGVMHACGHDAHTTILLGVAKILSEKKDELGVNVRFIFQPAEETVGGAEPMIEEGVLEGVDAIFGLHVSSLIDKGSVEYRYKQMNASSDRIEIEVQGRSAHGAYPGDGVDAIMITAQLITAMQSIVSRIDARDSVVLTIGMIEGGTAPNIIADSVKLVGTLRTLDPKIRESVKEKLKILVDTLPVSMGGKGVLKVGKGYSPLINDDKMVDLVRRSATDILGIENVLEKEKANMGVEDFGYYLEKIPGVFFNLGVKNEKKGITALAHNDCFDIDEDALHLGVAIQILNVLSV